MKFRTINKAIAFLGGYFWLPCPCCGQEFGGHEWKFEYKGNSTSIDGNAICNDCAAEGKGNSRIFTIPVHMLGKQQKVE